MSKRGDGATQTTSLHQPDQMNGLVAKATRIKFPRKMLENAKLYDIQLFIQGAPNPLVVITGVPVVKSIS